MGSQVFTVKAGSNQSVARLLEAAKLSEAIGQSSTVMLKPNLVEALQPPITTPVGFVADIIDYIKQITPEVKIIVAEGSGAADYDTWHSFESLGYTAMAAELGVQLIDLNTEPLTKLEKNYCRRWPQMYLPEIIFDVFLISIPVLKAHSLAGVTLSMKNMMGIAPPAHYQQGGHWKKAAFHENVQVAVFDLNQYRAPDYAILDASVGMQEAHLWGPSCNPPHNTFAASSDPVAIDAYGTQLLKRKWQQIAHIARADGVLGSAQSYQIYNVS